MAAIFRHNHQLIVQMISLVTYMIAA